MKEMRFVLRLCRVLAVMAVCFVVFSIVFSYVNDPEDFRGPLHAIGSLIFMLAFFLPYSAPLVLGIAWALMAMDQLSLRRLWHSVLFWSVLGILPAIKQPLALPLAALTGLIYWALVGRLAGRPGYAWQSIKQGGLLPKALAGLAAVYAAYVLASWAVFGSKMAWVTAYPPDLGDPPFAVQFDREMTARMKVAMMEFSDAETCVVPNSGPVEPGKMVPIDWDRIDSNEAAKVCLFRTLAAFGELPMAGTWLEGQGFRVNESGFNSENPYFRRDGTLRVDGTWSVREQGLLYEPDTLFFRAMASITLGTGVHTTWSADGRNLLWVSLSSTTF
ncbi:MAG: hypothetical protein GTO62_00005 [Planctomycetales bacterium]|nr:hypothetical protein [Planctomycetales bacterium]